MVQLKPRELGGFLAKPDRYDAVLLYGPDEGLVRSRRNAILDKLGIKRDDPFAYNEYEQSQILDNPSQLHEALSAISLMGEAPCISVSYATDKLTSHIADTVGQIPHNQLIITAGDLPKRSSLRALFDNAKATAIASIACYRDEGRGLEQIIDQFLRTRHITADHAARQALTSYLGNDRAVTMNELEKIDLYLGEDRRLTEDSVTRLLADNSHRLTSDALLFFFTCDLAPFFTLSDNALRSGDTPISMIRTALRILRQLLQAKQLQDTGKSAPQAIDALRPFVFFRDKPSYSKALQRLSMQDLLGLHHQLERLELKAKSGTYPLELTVLHGLLATVDAGS